MVTIALVGGDGAGKTTVAQMLQQSFPLPIKYLYMGTSIQSSNVALPTSRLVLYIKQRLYRKRMAAVGTPVEPTISAHDLEYQPIRRGRIGRVARLLNRVSEQWYRQLVAWYYQQRGYIVLFDRHFLFEYTPQQKVDSANPGGFSERLHRWQLSHLYPQPDLTLFLDAPPDVLYVRKAEWSPERLERYRQAVLEQGAVAKNFVRIDAAQPLEAVFADVVDQMQLLIASKGLRMPMSMSMSMHENQR